MSDVPFDAAAALQALVGVDLSLITPDELVALQIVREALQGIANGEDLNPPPDGAPLKKRLCRRVDVSWFHPNTPRPRKVIAS